MYGKKVKLRAFFILLIFLSAILTIFLVIKALEENVVYFKSPSEIRNLSELGDKKIRVGGMVKKSSIIAIIGLINVPIIKFSVDWWSTLHQPASVNLLKETTIHSSMLVPLAIMTAAFALFSLLIFLMKYNTELIKIKNKGLDRL